MTKSITSIEEFEMIYFPKELLNSLEEELCKEYGLNYFHQHKLSKDSNNPKTGFIEVAIPCGYPHSPENFIKSFYLKRNYKVNQEDKILEVKKQNEFYLINILEGSSSYLITIREDILAKNFSKC